MTRETTRIIARASTTDALTIRFKRRNCLQWVASCPYRTLIEVTQKLKLRVGLTLTMFTNRPLLFKPSEQRLPLFAIFRDSAWRDVPQRKPLRRQVHVILRVAQIAHHR